MGDLRNPAAARWDWDKYLRENVGPGYFPRGITHADLDNETEINGHFLVTEGKRAHEQLSTGQRYAMNARVRDGRTCIIVYGCPEDGTIDFLQHYPHPPIPADWRTYWRICHEWAAWAESAARPEDRPSAFVPSHALEVAA